MTTTTQQPTTTNGKKQPPLNAPKGTTATRAANTRPKQQKVPGTEQDIPEDLLEKAEEYRNCRDDRMLAAKRESEARAMLHASMESNGIEDFVIEETGERVYFEGERKVVVRKPKKSSGGDEE